MDMEHRKFLAGGQSPAFDFTSTLPVAFPAADLASLEIFAAEFSSKSFPAYTFEPVLPASLCSGSSRCLTGLDRSWPQPVAFPPMTGPATSQLLCPLSVSPGSDASSDLSFVPIQDFPDSEQRSPNEINCSLAAELGNMDTILAKSAIGKTKKRMRKPKPRMSELSESEAQAKRDSNRESARKSRDRKRVREKNAIDENVLLRKEVAELKLKVKILSELLLEKGKML